MMNKLKQKIHELTEKYSIVDIAYKSAHGVKVHFRKKLNDIDFAKKYYLERTRKILNLEHPLTFDEKQWWLKLYYRDPLMTICADKFLIRNYVNECGLGHILNDLYGVYACAEEIDLEKLPEKFILKTNHGCGGNFICQDKNSFQKDKVFKKLNKLLKTNYYDQSREWVYRDIPPRIIAEKLLINTNGDPLVDYRMLCFDGKCRCVFVDIDTCDETGKHKVNAKRNVYDENMNLINIQVTRERFDPSLVSKPLQFNKMREYAEILSKPFPFCRVDFYYVDERIILGEMTFFHAGGCSTISPPEIAYEMGEWIKLAPRNN